MAKTYVGYVKREVKDEIDWASIGSGISDMLLAERKAREDKKKEIDDASREFAKVLTDAEGSEHTGINQFFLDGSNSISEIRLMQDRLLKSGQLRLRDYNIQRQNIVDGTNEMLSLVKDYDTKYKEKMARLQNEESAAQEIYQMEQIEGFSNFQNHRLYVNPTNGQISVGKTVPGKGGINELSKNPNDFSTMQALRNRLNIKIDRYDWSKNLQQGVDNLAKVVIAKNSGAIKTAEDARQLEDEYTNAKNNWIDSMMTNSVNVGSMLTDWIGGYTFTQDILEAGRDDSKILLVPDPRQPSSGNLVPKLSDAQEKIVKERLEQEFESRVDRIETARTEFPEQKIGTTGLQIQKTELGYLQDLNKIITASPEIAEAAIADRIEDVNRYNQFKKIDSKITRVERDYANNRFKITFEEPKGRRTEVIDIRNKDANTIGQELARYLAPQISSYSSALNNFINQEGGFTVLEPGVVPSPVSRGVGFTEKPAINLTTLKVNPEDKKSKVYIEEFSDLGGAITPAADLVNKALNATLNDITKNISVQAIDETGPVNTIKINIDGQLFDVKYDDDTAKLTSDIQNIITKIISKYNTSGQKVDENGIPIN